MNQAAPFQKIEEQLPVGAELTRGNYTPAYGLGKPRVIGRDLQVFEETTSTNDVLEKLARDGVPEGAVVFAESQSRGRGRLGRKWVSPARKGLWPQQNAHLACVELRRTGESTAVPTR